MDEADDVQPVVLEDGFQQRARPAAQIGEVGVRDQRARDGVVPLVTEDAFLDHSQRAALEAVPVEGSDQGEQVHMRRMVELTGHASHHPARLQNGQVERPAVEAGEAAGRCQLLTEAMEEGRFQAGLRQEELGQPEAAVERERNRGCEDIRARAAAEPGGLGVDVGHRTRMWVERRQGDDVLAEECVTERGRHRLESPRQLEGGLRLRSRPGESP